MEDNITLDRKTFKALAADTRIEILKELGKRRKTQSELAKCLGMSNSTIKEHLDNLEEVGLVIQIDDGHKWKYYELTRKGKKIVSPEETRIWIALGTSILALSIATRSLLRNIMPKAEEEMFVMRTLAESYDTATGSGAEIAQYAPKSAPDMLISSPPWYAEYIQSPYTDIAFIILFAVILGITIGWLIRSRHR